jgi:outer membrane protein assembly factor BamD (BamD/ComL family)
MKTTSLFSRLPRGRLQMAAALLLLIAPMGAMPAARAADGKASELLEKGVYSEETKGDFDAAIQFYQQAIAEVDAEQALGAQAQFRLAMCYDKKKDRSAATAAFEKLIRDYPTHSVTRNDCLRRQNL